SPYRRADLPLRDPREPIVRGPAVEEVSVEREALAERREKPRRVARFAKRVADRLELMPAVAAVLLPFAAHAVNEMLLGAVVQGVDGGVEKTLKRRLIAPHVRFIRPRKDASPRADARDRHRT